MPLCKTSLWYGTHNIILEDSITQPFTYKEPVLTLRERYHNMSCLWLVGSISWPMILWTNRQYMRLVYLVHTRLCNWRLEWCDKPVYGVPWKSHAWFARAWNTPWKTARSLKTPWKWFSPWKLLEFEEAVLEFYEKVLEYLRIQQNEFILTSKILKDWVNI